MEKKEKRNEVVLLLLAILPIVYLFISWKSLPEPVPVHYGVDMQPNGYQSKRSLAICMVLFTAAFYLLFKYIYKIDPKRKIAPGSKVYTILRFAIGILISALGLLIVIMAQSQAAADLGQKIILYLVGALFIVLGNYLPVVKQNYFIGIRTPWTLDNEVVWQKTHRVGGRVFMVGGVLIILSAFFSDPRISFAVLLTVSLVIALFAVVYSWFLFNKLKKTPES
jgi:uncharacterized membrane protein